MLHRDSAVQAHARGFTGRLNSGLKAQVGLQHHRIVILQHSIGLKFQTHLIYKRLSALRSVAESRHFAGDCGRNAPLSGARNSMMGQWPTSGYS